MLLAFIAIIGGLILLMWSADRFIDGAAATAGHLGMPPLLIGLIVVGFGTSAPEMMVSALASLNNNPGIALGNAFGSNITNIALILGTTALIAPILVTSTVLKREAPILIAITLLSVWPLVDGQVTSQEAWTLLAIFAFYLGWTTYNGMKSDADSLSVNVKVPELGRGIAVFWMVAGLILLVISSRFLVWGAVEVATALGVSDLIIGLTIVAIGTSLPEFASSIAAIRKNEHDLAIGNIIGSNIFNTLVVVGIAGAIHPITLEPELLTRDWSVMMGLTLLLMLFAFRPNNRPNRINRVHGGIFLACYIGYTTYLIYSGFSA
ncbi:cation:H+ antiporter [Pseudidiomarina indica]|uniref:Cation:H+ antiporter n=1 Tax=Pseudidiomarina indica TaxID=1159017 RepID=A0A1G6BKU3_9GAMM|nr:calcium/sodium antiporter [Pseudidiomarina indica]SDB21252.1 cation:H+ antiporter [Pseudidiomarina indica]